MRKIVLLICLIHATFSFSATFGSVVFSELMVDPDPAVGLPPFEYLEVYNRSEQSMNFYGWSLLYGDKSYPFPNVHLDAHSFGLICSRDAVGEVSSSASVFAFERFPVLSNSGKELCLLNEKGELVFMLNYSSHWHSGEFKAKGGWSLECLDVQNLSGEAANWTSSVNSMGGTPGAINSVARENPDRAPFYCTSVYVLHPNQVELDFSKSLNPDFLPGLNSFVLRSQHLELVSVCTTFPACRSVVLNFKDSIPAGVLCELNLSGLMDVSGQSIRDTVIPFGLPETPLALDLSLNEFVFNPKPGGCDYVEFVNVSEKCLDVSQVWLSRKTEDGSMEEGVRLSEKPRPCLPGSYWLLSVNADSVFALYGGVKQSNFIDLTSLPSMPDDLGNLILVNKEACVLDELMYDEKMHFTLLRDKEGVSLEKIHPNLPSLKQESWTSASSVSGFGTPGRINSCFQNISLEKKLGFDLRTNWLTPNGDGQDDVLEFTYQLEEPGMASLSIYDLHGRLVRQLLKDELLSSIGSVFWNGTADDGRLLPFGRYVMNLSFFTPGGRVYRKRYVLTVLF